MRLGSHCYTRRPARPAGRCDGVAIHPTAIVSPQADLGADVEVDAYAIVEAHVRLGDRTRVHARAHVCEHTSVGPDCEIHPGVILGHIPQDKKFTGEPSFLQVGARNVFRENAWLHRGSAAGSATVIGDDNYFMGGSRVAQNCVIGNHVTLAPNLLLGGHVYVEDWAFISGNVVVHQFCRVGRASMVSGLSGVNQDVPPFLTVGGRPAAVLGLNGEGLRRAEIPDAIREQLKRAYRVLFRSELDLPAALDQVEADATSDEERHLVAFIRASRVGDHARGICQAPRRHHQPGLDAELDDRLAAEEATALLGLS